MSFQDRLKQALSESALNQGDVARKAGMSPGALTMWKNGTIMNPEARNVSSIARVLGINSDWLIDGKGPMRPPEPGNIRTEPRPIKAFGDHDPVSDDEIQVKRLTLIASAGSGRLQWEIDEKGTPNRYRRAWCERLGFTPEKLVTVQIDGDSMIPHLVNGGSVVINTADTTPRSGKIYAVDYRGEFFMKRLFVEPDGAIRVTSDNPDKTLYPDWIVKPEHGDVLRVLGRAVQTQNDL